VESVAMQRNLGPKRLCVGAAPVSDPNSPTSYQATAAWDACRARLEQEYARSLGVKKIIWVPTGLIEDTGTFRGPVGRHLHITEFQGKAVDHPGVYTLYTTNGHADEFIRFISEDTVLLAQADVRPLGEDPSPLQRLTNYLERQNDERLEMACGILSRATTAEGKPIKVVRIPTAELMYEVMEPGDRVYDYFAAYTRWDAGERDKIKGNMFAVLPTSYVNYFPTGDVVLVAKYWKEGRAAEMKQKDEAAQRIIAQAFPDRTIVPIEIENINLGGGGINCISQQQPVAQ